ncbi:MAG TPA: helix-turn-helix transcriptional regulator [bacterium]|nr:helix-turn-helix transcriptional regulator [bacterium]
MAEKNVPALVKGLREAMSLTQEQFAQKVGVTFSTVNQWENGHRRPQPYLLRRLLEMKEEFDVKVKRSSKRKAKR